MEEEDEVLFSEVQIMRDGDDIWHGGLIDEFHPERGYHVQYFDGEDQWIPDIHDEFVRIDKTGSGGGKASKRASKSKSVHDDDDLMMAGGDNTDFDFFDQEEEEELAIIPNKKPAATKSTTKTSPRPFSATGNDSTMQSTRFFEAKRELDSPITAGSPSELKYRETLLTAMDDLDGVLAPTIQPQKMNEFQDKNREIITSQLTYLHPRGVLFVGSIFNVTLPRPDITDGRILFRVLFIEGGNQPAMFRCKTPIFTSSSVAVETAKNNELSVNWNDHTFRFDMVMPTVGHDEETAKADSPFVIQGEVMISIYRARTNGGNDLLGQFNVDLKTFRSRGTVEFFAPGSEGRSMNGVYPLLLPQSKESVGEMEIQFNISWKGNAVDPPVEKGKDNATKSEKVMPNTTVKSIGTKSINTTKAGSKTPNSRPQSAGPRTRPTTSAIEKPNLNNHVNGREPRKIISKLQRKMKEDERRIKRENEILQSKLSKHGANTANNAVNTAKGAAYGAVTTAFPANKQQQAQGYQEPINPALEKHTEAWKKLAAIHEQLKKALRDDENALKDMKSKLSNLNTNIARQEAGIDRAKMVSNIQQLSASNNNESMRQSINSLQPSTTSTTSTTTVSLQLGKLENVADGQYHQIREEYEVLQRMRRGLVERRKQAEITRNQSLSQAKAVQRKMEIATKRILHIAVTEFPSMLTDYNNAMDAKADTKQQEDESDDLQLPLLDSLRSVVAEQALVDTLQEDNHELMQLLSTREELEAILQHLEQQAGTVKKEIDVTMDQKQSLLLDLQNVKEHQGELHSRRAFVTLMKGMELRLKREQRLGVLVDGVRDIELQMVRLKMLAVERQQLGMLSDVVNAKQHEQLDGALQRSSRVPSPQQQADMNGGGLLLDEHDVQDLYDIVVE